MEKYTAVSRLEGVWRREEGSRSNTLLTHLFLFLCSFLAFVCAFFGCCSVTVVPADYPWEKVLEMNPDGVFFSNGPGDPSAAPYAVDNAKNIIGKVPSFGICMGHQILGQAFGGTTYKLKFGHHGGNHPIKNTLTDLIEISAQNHNFAVDPDTLPADVTVTHVNLNDGTVAGMVSEEKNVLTIQYVVHFPRFHSVTLVRDNNMFVGNCFVRT